MGVVHRPHPDWATHIPVLVTALNLTDGPVLELGMGMMSTPILHTLCEMRDRILYSFENDTEFIRMFRNFNSPSHRIALVDWDDLELSGEWDVVLVDQKPAELRAKAVKTLTDCGYLILHDSQDPDYGYDEIYPLFKYRYTYKKFPTWTTVLSNKHNVDIFRNSLA